MNRIKVKGREVGEWEVTSYITRENEVWKFYFQSFEEDGINNKFSIGIPSVY